MGTVYSVKLCEDKTSRVVGLYACKVILKSFIVAKSAEKRKLDL